jgi:hypothetical protein
LRSQNERRSLVIVEIEQPVGEIVQRQTNTAESLSQIFENITELTPLRGFVGCNKLVIGSADLLVKSQVRATAFVPALRAFVKNAAHEQGIVSDVRAKKKGLLASHPLKRNEHVGNVFMRAILDLVRTI